MSITKRHIEREQLISTILGRLDDCSSRQQVEDILAEVKRRWIDKTNRGQKNQRMLVFPQG